MEQTLGDAKKETLENSAPPKGSNSPNRAQIINVTYIIVALDITWMFVQIAVTPVSYYEVIQCRYVGR